MIFLLYRIIFVMFVFAIARFQHIVQKIVGRQGTRSASSFHSSELFCSFPEFTAPCCASFGFLLSPCLFAADCYDESAHHGARTKAPLSLQCQTRLLFFVLFCAFCDPMISSINRGTPIHTRIDLNAYHHLRLEAWAPSKDFSGYM